MSVRLKLIGAFLFVVLGALTLSGTALFATWSLGGLAQSMFDGPLQSISFARSAQTKFAVMELEIRLVGQADPGRFDQLAEDFLSDLVVVTERDPNPDVAAFATTITEGFGNWRRAAELARSTDPMAIAMRDRVAEGVRADLEALVQIVAADGYVYWLDLEADVAETRTMTFALVGMVLLITVAVVVWLIRDLVRPLRRFTNAMTALARGSGSADLPERDRRDEIGDMADALVIFGDAMTQVRAAKDAAETAARAKADFLAMMSHEIRTPMNGVLGMARLLERSELDEPQREKVATLIDSADSLMTILDDVLDLSKLEADGMELERRPFSIRTLVGRTVDLLQGRAAEKGLTLSAEIAPGLEDSRCGDPNRLRQILLNLLGNAIKFTGEGSVTVTVSEEVDGCMTFAVRDTGIGIAADRLDSLFESFRQADASIARTFGGTGLGLSISKRLATLMGGGIRVESREGFGSIFTLAVPLEVTDAAMEAEIAAPEPTVRPLRILVAEDNRVNRTVIGGLLAEKGHTVRMVGDGAEAVTTADGTFDLILMDIGMPVIDGLEATRRIRTPDHPARDVPILAVTAGVTADELARIEAAGMNGMVAKPITPAALYKAIAEAAPDGEADTPAPEPFEIEVVGGEEGPDDDIGTLLSAPGPALEPSVLATLADQLGDEFVAEIVGDYRETAATRIGEIEAAMTAGDAAALSDAAHGMKGATGSVGLRNVFVIAREIEERAPSEGTIALQEWVSALQAAVQSGMEALSDHIGGGTPVADPEGHRVS